LRPSLITWEKEDWEERIASFAKSSSQALLLDDVWKILFCPEIVLHMGSKVGGTWLLLSVALLGSLTAIN
jgi:hypothetical protein